MEDEALDKFYLSHLNYAGRGNNNRKDDVVHQTTRQAMDLLFDTCWRYQQEGQHKEFVTGNNDADGVYLLFWVRKHFPATGSAHARQAGAVGRQLLWREHRQHRQSRQRPPRHLLVALHPRQCARAAVLARSGRIPPTRSWPASRRSPRQVKGRCGECTYFDICGGNTRVRA